jgi:hypothetical protein
MKAAFGHVPCKALPSLCRQSRCPRIAWPSSLSGYLIFVSPWRAFPGIAIVRRENMPKNVLTFNLSVYRQTDDSFMVKRELFLFRLPVCVYAE